VPKIIPNLWFDGNAEEAVDFYVGLFPNSQVDHVLRATSAGPGPEGSVVTIDFRLDGQRFTAINGGPQFTFDEAVSFLIECADQDEIDHWWSVLTADGGEESQCGWLKDRFGLSWQVCPANLDTLYGDYTDGAARAMQAMFGMKKLDIAALEAAYEGAA
jgi:predicted 3-demethylubiquinone-9 3-methyltransferase (glyoxalase superfamily)